MPERFGEPRRERGKRVGVLISGRGSNLQALIDAAAGPRLSRQDRARAVERPWRAGLGARRGRRAFPRSSSTTRTSPRATISMPCSTQTLKQAGIELLCNAGFMRLHTEDFVRSWWNRHLNIHPSLLPAFKGLHTHARVLAEGVKITGCTVHFVQARRWIRARSWRRLRSLSFLTTRRRALPPACSRPSIASIRTRCDSSPRARCASRANHVVGMTQISGSDPDLFPAI